VHQDVKPQNIVILDEPPGRDFVKLLDFGLARVVGDDAAFSQASQLIGTPYYMAPELYAGRSPTTAADLYAVGLILCEAHLGRPLLDSSSLAALQVTKAALVELPADVHPVLRDVLRDLVEPNPARRPQVAAEVRARLERCAAVASESPMATPVVAAAMGRSTPLGATTTDVAVQSIAQPLPRRRPWIAAAGAAIAGGLVVAGFAIDVATSTDVADAVRAAHGLECVLRDEGHADVAGRGWKQVWFCGNDANAPVYAEASGAQRVGWMETRRSWFVCFRRGERHAGGDDVWYYTQGDWVERGWEKRHAWGYMPAVHVHARAHPYPGVPACP